ncbi:MAG: class I SAM-dependent methyltransferase [Myxococcales bacterium]|nr:class I SAM-dependent methyltransferase [Myxococcales bacterium]
MNTPALRPLPLATLLAASLLACAAKPVPTEAPPAEGAVNAQSTPEGASSAGEGDRAAIEAAVAAPHRADKNRARDGARHPVETLTFFGLRPAMTVVELWPGGGWYTEILAATVHGKGKLIATNFDPNASSDPKDYRVRVGKAFLEKLESDPVYEGIDVVTVGDPKALVLAPEGSVDLVLTFRNSHGWIEDGSAEAIYGAAFRALKPGGVLGVVQHRAKADDAREPKAIAETGYVREDYLIQTIEAVGFELAGKSEVNANPKDTKDYAKGVWTLPPGFSEGDTDRAKYEAIGESDRMTLRFVKPAG